MRADSRRDARDAVDANSALDNIVTGYLYHHITHVFIISGQLSVMIPVSGVFADPSCNSFITSMNCDAFANEPVPLRCNLFD